VHRLVSMQGPAGAARVTSICRTAFCLDLVECVGYTVYATLTRGKEDGFRKIRNSGEYIFHVAAAYLQD